MEKSSWDTNCIQRLTTPYGGIEYVVKAEKLKEYVKIMIEGTTDLLAQLQLIDDLQRLDVSHYFQDSVHNLLDIIYAAHKTMKNDGDDLHATALKLHEEIKRGDVPKSIQCYMHETGCSEEEARRNLIYELWKKMNKETLLAEEPFSITALNLVRMSLCFYLNYGD